jgi:hypothetical protein
MNDLYKANEPSGCIISDCCNFILSISDDPDPFGPLSDEEFQIVMSEIAMSINYIANNMDILQSSTGVEELFDLVHSMKEVNRMATAEVNENRNI